VSAALSERQCTALPDELRGALREASPELLRVLRTLNDLRSGRPGLREALRELDPRGAGLSRARELGLLEGSDERPAPTELGAAVFDGVKQYWNWLKRRDELPRGVTAEMVAGRRVLDVGCGVGCSLMTFARHGARALVGVDVMPVFVELGRVFAEREGAPTPELHLCDAARMPLRDASCGFVFSRIALNYMRADRVIAEMARVASDGADLALCVNGLPWSLRALGRAVRGLRFRRAAFFSFSLLNGAVYNTLGTQLTLRHAGAMHASHSPVFLTARKLRRELRQAGCSAAAQVIRAGDTLTVLARRSPRDEVAP